MLKHIFLAIAPTQPPLETSSDLRNDLRSDVTTTLPLLQQVASGYTLTTLASGQILLTPIANRTMVKPRRLQQQQLPSFSLSSPPTELTPQMHAGLLSTSSTPVHDFENQDRNLSSGSCTPSPTVAFPPQNDDSSSLAAGVSSSPLQEKEQQLFTPLSCTPSPTVAFPSQNDDSSSLASGVSSSQLHENDHQPFTSLSCTPSNIFPQEINGGFCDVNVGPHFRHFSPFQILPIPKVPQTGPRPKYNRKLGSARNLTSEEELQKSKSAFEEKCGKEKRKQELALKRQQKNSSQKTAINNGKKNQMLLKVCLYFKIILFYYFYSE